MTRPIQNRTEDEMYRIAAAGGGFHMSAKSFTVDQLYRIAAAASGHGARITITEANHLTTDQLYRIAASGKGAVAFE